MRKKVTWGDIKDSLTQHVYLLLSLAMIVIFGVALLHRLGTVPQLEIDEVTYLNEIRSLVKYGTDIHGLHWPLYFAGVFGYGQSVEYAYFAVPIIKLIGYSLMKARLPMVLLIVFTMGVVVWNTYKHEQKSLSFWLVLSIVSSPWIFISGRWVLDCNIAPITFLLGILFLSLAWSCNKQRNRIVSYLISALMIIFSVAGYMAGWLYIPIALVLIMWYVLMQHKMKLKSVVLYCMTIFIGVVPMIVFAFHFLVEKSANAGHFLWFSYPAMPILRGESFIDFQSPHLIKVMLSNFIAVVNGYIGGTDGLPWNSVAPFGVVFPFLLGFAVIGIFTPKRILSTATYHLKNILVIALIAFIPLMFVITPNYYHSNFINWLIVLLVGFGLYYIQSCLSKKIVLVSAPIMVVMMIVFVTVGYYGHSQGQITYFTQRDVTSTDIKTIATLLKPKNHHKKRLFVFGPPAKLLQAYSMYNNNQPITNQRMLQLSDNKKNFDLKDMSAHHRYANLYDETMFSTKYHKGDLILAGENDVRFTRISENMVEKRDKNKIVKYKIIRRVYCMNNPFILLEE